MLWKCEENGVDLKVNMDVDRRKILLTKHIVAICLSFGYKFLQLLIKRMHLQQFVNNMVDVGNKKTRSYNMSQTEDRIVSRRSS